jgi:hypothetical protein
MTDLQIKPFLNVDNLDTAADDHFVCCSVEDGFAGFTTAFCGDVVFLSGDEEDTLTMSVPCEVCTERANEMPSYCPLGRSCGPSGCR